MKHKILIVDDEISLLNALCDKFKREGFCVLEAKDGEVGFNLAIKERPQLILLDLVMPKVDGTTMLKKLRQKNEWGKNVPVILLTNLGSDNKKIMKEITEDKSTDYLVKSNWAINDVVGKVREKLAQIIL